MSWTTPLIALPHLSDEAVAAFADGVLSGSARQRAQSHMAGCAECSDAVYGQRSASAMLRSASAPSVPTGLLERLRELPITAELPAIRFPSGLSADGQPMFAAFSGPGPVAEAGPTALGAAGFGTAPFSSPWSGPATSPPVLAAPLASSPAVPGAALTPARALSSTTAGVDAPVEAGPHDHPGSSGHPRRRASSRTGLGAAAVAVVAVGMLASTAAAAGGVTTTGRPTAPRVAPSRSPVVTPAFGPAQPALLTFIPNPR